jgi:hypothetical protein
MPRGGKRAGAGRPISVDFYEEIVIGSRCEQLWSDAQQQLVDRLLAGRFRETDKVRARLDSIPVAERTKWLRSDAHQDYLDDFEFALKEQQGIDAYDERVGQRVHSIRKPRPKGVRNHIIKQVAEEETAKRGKPISQSIVERCWKRFRSFERRDRV